jgi:hypothetical protein
MFNVVFDAVKPADTSGEFEFWFTSHAIDTFALFLSLAASADERAALGQPILVTLREDEPNWLEYVEALARSSTRMVIAINEDWLEDHYQDDHGYDVPMATAYEIVDGQFVITPGMLHHSRNAVARLVAENFSEAYAVFCDGSGCWEELDAQFAANAHIGIKRAGETWFWEHDARTTKDLIAVMEEMEMEERLGINGPLPGVVLNLGRR